MCWKLGSFQFKVGSKRFYSLPQWQNSRGDSAARKIVVRASAVENWSTALRGLSAAGARWLILLTFLFFFYTILTSSERGASAVENLGSPRY